MKKILLIILLSFIGFSTHLQAQDTPPSKPTTQNIYFGGEYSDIVFVGGPLGESRYFGGYIGLETNFGHPYLSMINTFGVLYSTGFGFGSFAVDRSVHFVGPYHSIGLRAYLGTPYVFMDFNVGVGFVVAQDNKDSSTSSIMPLVPTSITLGFNIPLTHDVYLQMMGDFSYMQLFYSLKFQAGIQFKI